MIALASCATPSTPFEDHPVLAKIKFEGNKSISSSDLLSKIATSPTTGFFTKTARYYDADLFAIDEKRIVRWYNQKGFYEAKVEKVDEARDDKGRVTLTVHLDEGRRAVIRKQTINGASALTQSELGDVDHALPIHPGDDFDEDGYEKALLVLEAQLKEHGFAQAEVQGSVKVMPEEGAAEVTFEAKPGIRYKFGKVVISGNRAIPADQIAFATGIDPDEPFSPSALALAQQRVYNLGTFSGVRVGLEPLTESPVAAVRVNVREAPFQTIRGGIGFQIEDTRWQLPVLHGEYTNRSLLGGLRRLELGTKVGYAFVPDLITWLNDPAVRGDSGLTNNSFAQLTVPNVFLPGLDAVARGEFAREFQSGFHYDEVAARFSLLYRRGRHSVSPSLNFVRYFRVGLSQSLDLVTLFTKGGAGAGLLQSCAGGCTLTYPELRYSYDARDNAFEPTDGFYATLDLQQTLKPGSFTYFRVQPEVRVYRPVGRFLVFAARALYGALITEGGSESPFTQRFFGGGQNANRGYAPLREGPKLGAAPVTANGGSTGILGVPFDQYASIAVPSGGNGTVLLSAELRLKTDYLFKNTAIVAFADASRVTQNAELPWSGQLEIAPGLGLRYLTPFGPLRFDVGFLLNPTAVTTQAFSYKDAFGNQHEVQPTVVSSACNSSTLSCIHESRWAYHLSLGEAF